jgi:hypothetical protein
VSRYVKSSGVETNYAEAQFAKLCRQRYASRYVSRYERSSGVEADNAEAQFAKLCRQVSAIRPS